MLQGILEVPNLLWKFRELPNQNENKIKMMASRELPKMPSYFDMALFSTSQGQWEVPGTSANFLGNFPKCSQVGKFLNSIWKFQVFGGLETAVKPFILIIKYLNI